MRNFRPEDPFDPWRCRGCGHTWAVHRVHPAIRKRGTCAACDLRAQAAPVRQAYAVGITYLAALCNPAERKKTA